jgi:ABC-type antimicrobial peptide transport system permease subunit
MKNYHLISRINTSSSSEVMKNALLSLITKSIIKESGMLSKIVILHSKSLVFLS